MTAPTLTPRYDERGQLTEVTVQVADQPPRTFTVVATIQPEEAMRTDNLTATPLRHTAMGAYIDHQEKIARLLARLEEGRRAHAARQVKDPRNWGYSGDLAEVERVLAQALEHLGDANAFLASEQAK